MNRLAALLALAVVAPACLTSPVHAQPSGGSLQLALDKPVDLTIPDPTPIGEVFAKLSAATGIKVVVSEDALDALPYGDQTRLSVTLKNATARSALGKMLNPQALRWEIKDEAVQIVPGEALYRLGRRATYDELRLLGTISSEDLRPVAEAGSVVEQLRKAAGVKDVDVVFRVETDRPAAFARGDRALPGTAAAWLDMLCMGQAWTWYVLGNQIIILDQKAQTHRQLGRLTSLRYQNANLVTVLSDLARKARVRLVMDPGVMNYLPSEARTNFGMIMADASIEQALQVISGETGLQFTITEEGIRVEASEKLKDGFQGGPGRTRTPLFLRMSLPGPNGANIEVFVRADEMSEELLQAILAEKARLLNLLSEQYLQKPPAVPPASPPPPAGD